MRVKMLASREVSLSGADNTFLREGDVVEMRDELAQRQIEKGYAESTRESPSLRTVDEPSDPAGAAWAEPNEDDENDEPAGDEPNEDDEPAGDEPNEDDEPAGDEPNEDDENDEPAGDEPNEDDELATAEVEFPSLEELLKLKRPELDAYASANGVEAPGELANKQAVAEAILATRGGA